MSNNRSTTFSKGSRSGSTRRVVDHGNGRVETFEDRREKDYAGKVTVRSERTSVQKSDQWFRDQERNADKERRRQSSNEVRRVIAKMSGTIIGGQSIASNKPSYSIPPIPLESLSNPAIPASAYTPPTVTDASQKIIAPVAQISEDEKYGLMNTSSTKLWMLLIPSAILLFGFIIITIGVLLQLYNNTFNGDGAAIFMPILGIVLMTWFIFGKEMIVPSMSYHRKKSTSTPS